MKIFYNKTLLFLALIIVLATGLRFYKLGEVPPSITWDEAAFGYNAWSIVHYGRDEWGEFLPLSFKSFGEDKQPVDIYLTAIPIVILGLTDFATRFSTALFGVLNVLIIYVLAKKLTNSSLFGLSSAFLLSISPYAIGFSRFNHEANMALFFFMTGVWLFLKAVKGGQGFLPLSILSFGVSMLTYRSSMIVVPIIGSLLTALYIKQLVKNKFDLSLTILIGLAIIGIFIIRPELVGLNRASQTAISDDRIKQTTLYKQTGNMLLGRMNITGDRYLTHLTPSFLFIKGDPNPKFSTQAYGMFYPIEGLLFIFGLYGLIKTNQRWVWIIIVWFLVAPIPAAITGNESEAPHAARSLFMMGSWHMICAYALYSILKFCKDMKLKYLVGILAILVLGYGLFGYLSNYYGEYRERYGIEWQFGMKQIVNYIDSHQEYSQIYMTDIRSQPYIFFLYNLKTPMPDFRDTVIYNNTDSKSFNLVSAYDKYHFGDWNPIESAPSPGVLYIISSSQYDGLKYKSSFKIKEKIKYPNDTDAFYLISTN